MTTPAPALAILLSVAILPGGVVTLSGAVAQAQQLAVDRVELMPNHPRPYRMRDWAKVARDYDAFVFDTGKTGQYLPLIWWDETEHNYRPPGFGLPSYVGMSYQRRDDQHEAINCIAAVVGASLVGVDKSSQGGRDFVLMCQRYFSKDRGWGLYLNNLRGSTGGSFWYDTYPSLLFAHLLWLYPGKGEMEQHLRTSADRMLAAILAMGGDKGVPDFDHTAFDYGTMQPADNGLWTEPDAAAGYAWFEYMAYVRTGDERYLRGADLCMRFLERYEHNPLYELLLPYGACLAARMRAELGRRYDVHKLVDWSFGPTKVIRPGWGVIVDRWGDVDVAGLSGSTVDGGGYAFAMGTYDQASVVAPLARYDDRYARAIGKYLLNLANSARLFFADAHADDHQTSAAWANRHDPDHCIGYEGCRERARLNVTPSADYHTAPGSVVAGDYQATCVLQEAAGRAYEVLQEQVVGDHDRLEHLWALPLPPAVSRWLTVSAHSEDAGDGDAGFRFSYAAGPDGPFTEMFTVAGDGDRSYVYNLPTDRDGTLYVKVEDTNRTEGQTAPDRLYVDALFVRYEFDGKSPFAMGDIVGGSPLDCATDLGLYGSSHVGYLGGIVQTTDVEEILRLDLLKTDWYHGPAYPTYLYFNPHEESKTVTLDAGPEPRDLYETVAGVFIAKGATGPMPVTIPPDAAVVVVLCPAGGALTREGNRTLVDGVVVDYSYPTVRLTSPRPGECLGGEVALEVAVSAPEGDRLTRVVVDVDGRQVWAGEVLPRPLKFDTTRLADGRHKLTVTAEAASGAADRRTVDVLFANGVGTAFVADGPAIASWEAFPGAGARAEAREGVALLTVAQGAWGAVQSPLFELDADRRPAVMLDVAAADPAWWFKVQAEGGEPQYLQGDTGATGVQFLDVLKTVRRHDAAAGGELSGRRKVRLILGPAGRQGATATVRSVRVLYQEQGE